MAASRTRFLPYFFTAVFAAAWGLLGRLLLDWFQHRLGFNPHGGEPMLTFAVGPLWAWPLIAVLLWTPLTHPLRCATRTQALALGALVTGAGIVVLYVLFVFQMGFPSSVAELVNTVAFFPLFFISALAFGGVIAVPVILGTALLLRRLTRSLYTWLAAPGAA